MSNSSRPFIGIMFGIAISFAGCQGDAAPRTPRPTDREPAKAAEAKVVAAGQNVRLEVQGKRRRVLVDAVVCLREGLLEQLMCRRRTKEHEAILSADVDGRDIHKALIVAGAAPGSPVRYEPKFQPPRGTPIRVMLRYENRGETVTVPAQEWVRVVKTRKPLTQDWVFAGSLFIPDGLDKDRPPQYAANGGDMICVSNFEGAMLDLPIESSKDNDELSFEAFTEHIPPLDTKVVVILEPLPKTKK